MQPEHLVFNVDDHVHVKGRASGSDVLGREDLEREGIASLANMISTMPRETRRSGVPMMRSMVPSSSVPGLRERFHRDDDNVRAGLPAPQCLDDPLDTVAENIDAREVGVPLEQI